MHTQRLTLWWIRRDLRLGDNPALTAAVMAGGTVVPIFILDPAVLAARSHRSAGKRLAFLYDGLRQLADDLRARGSRLIVRRGEPLAVLSALVQATGAEIFAAEDFSPYARQRDAQIAAQLPLTLVSDITVHHPAAVVKADGRPYTVFTPFSRAWRALPAPGERDRLPIPAALGDPPDLSSEAVPVASGGCHVIPGEANAHAALDQFMEAGLYRYAARRDRLDMDGTSALSPYLRFGMISAREVVVAARQATAAARDPVERKGAEAWLNELIWREFYNAILYHFPEVLRQAFRPELRNVAWENDPAAFAAWCEGRTGYPVVDAAMRQLAETGWMHNRARMIAASFLVKDLLIDWRWGERWFMQHLIDGDLAANSGGWQWVAGVGTDAAPYFRVFNPVIQSRKFDPYGDFARAWLKELRAVPDMYIHEPWKMPLEAQRRARCLIGQDYPGPIIEHGVARARTLAAYRRPAPAA